MRKNSFTPVCILASFVLVVLGMLSCSKSVTDEDEATSPDDGSAKSVLRVTTRSGDGDDEVVYPVKIYVFNSLGVCVETSTIADGETSFTSMSLPAGTYNVLAVAGAADDRFELPTQSSASKDSQVSTKEGKTLDDVMTANASVILAWGAENSLTLNLSRKVLQLEEAVVKNVPANATDVTLTISPVYEYFLLNGEYGGTSGTHTETLTKQTDGTTWSAKPLSSFLYPSVGPPTFMVSFTVNGAIKTYSYTSDESLPANYKLKVEGTYTGTGILLAGTINGTQWQGTKAITFTFDDSPSSGSSSSTETGGNSGGSISGTVPPVNSTYKGCYVLKVSGNEATVLSAEQKKGFKNKEELESALANWDYDEFEATWRLPNKEEARLIYNLKSKIEDINSSINLGYYYKVSTDEYDIFNDNAGKINFTTHINRFDERITLRPVTTLTFE